MKLEQLLPYMPYGLQIKILNHKCDYVGIEYSIANGYYMIGDRLHVTYKGGSTGKDIDTFKPILRPMSDLTRDILYDAKFHGHIDYLTHEFTAWVAKYGISHVINRLPYGHVIWLLENHYDLFALIEQNLAISIHDLEK